MKLDRIPEFVTITAVTLGGVGFAVYCGRLAGSGDTTMLMKLLAVIIMVCICLNLRQRIWLLIPISISLGGSISYLPIPFSVRDLIILMTFGTFLALKAFKIVNHKPVYNLLDLLILINLLYLLTVFIRNPVGVAALGSDRVMGRAYVNVILATLAYWVLSRVTVQPKLARRLPVYMLMPIVAVQILNTVCSHFPSLIPVVSHLYSGVDASAFKVEAAGGADPAAGMARVAGLELFGVGLIITLFSYYRPVTTLLPFHFWRFALFILALYANLHSGYRTSMIATIAYFILASYFWRGIRDLAFATITGLPLLAVFLLAHGTLFDLPLTAQRTLSFLPGKWDRAASENARASSEWRYQLWQILLSSEGKKYMKQPVFGDGFGLSREDFEVTIGTLGQSEGDENALILGAFHSGPLTAIRYVGIVGFLFFMALLIYAAMLAAKLIRQARDTPYWPLALCICLPTIYQPFNYVFIFGGFDGDLPAAILGLGLLKMLSESLHAAKARQDPAPEPVGPPKRLVAAPAT